MKRGMTLETLLQEVQRQRTIKRDFVASTKDAVRMVEAEDVADGVALVLLREGASQLERFQISENCHRQIAGRLNVPWKYYDRLLHDHKDLVMHQVNALFEREPRSRLLRTLGDTARAFLSDRYRPLDNDAVLERALPPVVKGDIDSRLLSSNVTDNHLYLKVLFTDDSLAMDVGKVERTGARDIVRPGCIISNSETGHGSLAIRAFFWRSYCDNGCVFGRDSIFDFKRTHLGSQLKGNGDFEIFTDETRRKQDDVIIAEIADSMQALTDVGNVAKMSDALRATKEGPRVEHPFAAVDQLAREVDVRDPEKELVLNAFLRDQDFTRWGMLNAVTEVANHDAVDYERACEIERVGANIIDLNASQWRRIAEAEKVAA